MMLELVGLPPVLLDPSAVPKIAKEKIKLLQNGLRDLMKYMKPYGKVFPACIPHHIYLTGLELVLGGSLKKAHKAFGNALTVADMYNAAYIQGKFIPIYTCIHQLFSSQLIFNF